MSSLRTNWDPRPKKREGGTQQPRFLVNKANVVGLVGKGRTGYETTRDQVEWGFLLFLRYF